MNQLILVEYIFLVIDPLRIVPVAGIRCCTEHFVMTLPSSSDLPPLSPLLIISKTLPLHSVITYFFARTNPY